MTARPTLALLHSPFVGPLTWQEVAGVLRERGWTCLLPSLAGVFEAEDCGRADVVDRFVSELDHLPGELVLVGHSGAGPLLPDIAVRLGRVHALVHADSDLPPEGSSWVETAPVELVDRMHALVHEGRLAPWAQWFPADTVPALLPDPQQLARFVDELPRVPWTYLTEPTPQDPWHGPWAYVRLSDAYAAALATARARGVPVVELDGDHLWPLTHPVQVADAIEEVMDALRPTGATPSVLVEPDGSSGTVPSAGPSRPRTPTLHLVVGLPGSGKTTRARQIQRERAAIRLTPDEWVIPIFGPDNPERGRAVIEGRLLDIAGQCLRAGADVVVDFGLWVRAERNALRWFAEEHGAHCRTEAMVVDETERRRRCRARYDAAPKSDLLISDKDHAVHIAAFEPVTDEELGGRQTAPGGCASWGRWMAAHWPGSDGSVSTTRD